MIADHPQPDIVVCIRPVAPPGQFGRSRDHREDLIGLIHVVDALQQEGDAFQPGAGVDVFTGQLPGHVEVVLRPHR